MNNSKKVKKSIIYLVPVILMHIIFTLIDKNIQANGNDSDLRLSIIHMSIYFYFFLIPIYLMIINVMFNAKKKVEEYYKDVKLGALSILAGNILVLIINIVSRYTMKVYEINLITEFFIILIPELIMFIMIEFLGSFLVKKHDEDYEEETLEGLMIPKRKIEFYKKDETYKEEDQEDDEDKDNDIDDKDIDKEENTNKDNDVEKEDIENKIKNNSQINKNLDDSSENIFEENKTTNNIRSDEDEKI